MRKLRSALLFTTLGTLVACGGGTGTSSQPSTPQGRDPGGTGPGFYLPYVAISNSGGETGLFVVPSNSLSSTPVFVTRTLTTSQNVLSLGLVKKLSMSSSNVVTGSSPYALLYAAVGSDGNAHVYSVNLSDTSVAPAATQVSSLSLSSTADICGLAASAQTNLYDPTTWFVLLHTNAGGTASCGMGGDVYQVVHYSDSSTTAPVVINATAPFTALYQSSGVLGGLVLLDSATGDLDFYTDDTFTHPKVLVTGVSAWRKLVDDSTVDNTGSTGATTAFLSVQTASGTSLWRVPASGEASNVYTAAGTLSVVGVADNQSVYFSDDPLPGGTQAIYQEAISGGAPIALYRAASAVLTPAPLYMLAGSNGTSLVLTANGPPSASGTSTSVLTLPVGTPGTPAAIAGPFSGIVTVSMCPTTFDDVTSDVILMNSSENIPGVEPNSFSSEILTPGGVVKQPALANSAFLSVPGCGGFGSALQVRGISDTSGGYGGGTVSAVNLGSLAVTQLGTTTGSGTYTVPAGNVLSVTFLSANVGLGIVQLQPVGGYSTGIAFDLGRGVMVTVSVPNSSVSVFL